MERLIPWLLLAWVISRPAHGHASPLSSHGSMVLHQTPGRLRVRLSRSVDAASIERNLAAQPAILEMRFNPRSHTLLVCYDPARITDQEILTICQAALSPIMVPQGSTSPHLEKRAGELFGRALFDTFARQTIERSVFTMVTTVLKGR